MKYPNGKKYQVEPVKEETAERNHRHLLSAANRGMSLEEDINISNEFYKQTGVALITKRPTPINIVKVDYTHGARITDAYFKNNQPLTLTEFIALVISILKPKILSQILLFH